MTDNSLLLRAKGVTRTYRDGDRILPVLTGVDLDLHREEYISIVGQSGSGKSTLLHILGALDRATAGDVMLDGVSYASLGPRALASVRARKVGFIYQFHHLLPDFTALENVFLPGMIARGHAPQLIARATKLLERVGLRERMTHRPSRLSGGEQQRVALARALMNDPLIVLADEPTGDLDQKTGSEVMQVVLDETVGQGRSLIIVTHDPAVAGRAKRSFRIIDGRLVKD
jgi:predicted ABC-type transport system involved in lysophospholipase L1 biosynthesis ATPase subunit